MEFQRDTIRNVNTTSRAFKIYDFNPKFHLYKLFSSSHPNGLKTLIKHPIQGMNLNDCSPSSTPKKTSLL